MTHIQTAGNPEGKGGALKGEGEADRRAALAKQDKVPISGRLSITG